MYIHWYLCIYVCQYLQYSFAVIPILHMLRTWNVVILPYHICNCFFSPCPTDQGSLEHCSMSGIGVKPSMWKKWCHQSSNRVFHFTFCDRGYRSWIIWWFLSLSGERVPTRVLVFIPLSASSSVKLAVTNPTPVRCTAFCVPWLKVAFWPGGVAMVEAEAWLER